MPIFEEILFRGLLETALATGCSKLSISYPSLIASGISSVFFGACHNTSWKNKASQRHVISAIAKGILYSALSWNLGFSSAVGAHIMNNFVALYDPELVKNLAKEFVLFSKNIKEELGGPRKRQWVILSIAAPTAFALGMSTSFWIRQL